jgi:excinuclease ABC subunit B
MLVLGGMDLVWTVIRSRRTSIRRIGTVAVVACVSLLLYYAWLQRMPLIDLVSRVIGNEKNGLLSRYNTNTGVASGSIVYLYLHPFAPVGLANVAGGSGPLTGQTLGDSGPVQYLLRGGLVLLGAVYGGLWVFLRGTVRNKRVAVWLWGVTLAFELGSRQVIKEYKEFIFFPAAQFVTSPERIEKYIALIQKDMEDRVAAFTSLNKFVEAQRIEERTKNDVEMLREAGYCNGIENYSRYFSGRAPGSEPYTLLSFLPKDFLLFVDESHISVPQIRGMFNGDHQRKQTLIDYGFRLPSALDNRPLMFDEFMRYVRQAVFVSATPSDYEYQVSTQVAQQLLRPTGLVDPLIEVRPSKDQVPDLMGEIRRRVEKQERVLVTTLTKKSSELLADYLQQEGIKAQYLHSDLDALARVHILRQLRSGDIDVLVGVNLLREGLDLPEVSLVAILDADKEGFLRSETSLLQTMGRAARNVSGTIIMYADEITGSMSRAMAESRRRREYQLAYNEEHGITPQTIHKAISEPIDLPWRKPDEVEKLGKEMLARMSPTEVQALVIQLNEEMLAHAESLEFEEAAKLRDKIAQLRALLTGEKPPKPQAPGLMPRMGRHKSR